MKYKITKNCIEIQGKDDFSAKDILECGQIFAFNKTEKGYVVMSTFDHPKVTPRF